MINHSSNQPFKHLLNRILYGVLPGHCILCFEPSHRMFDLCLGCQEDLPSFTYPCWQCGLPDSTIKASGDKETLNHKLPDREICADCERAPPPFYHCYSAFQYQPPIDRLISLFKTGGNIIIGKVLSQALAEAYDSTHLNYPDIWIPVPLHRDKLRHRGFNQANEIAQVLEDITGIPVIDDICERTKYTADQKQLSHSERIKNIQSAFYVNRLLTGISVGLVDDVVTSGATVTELSHQLLDAGARDVQVICLARTPKKT